MKMIDQIMIGAAVIGVAFVVAIVLSVAVYLIFIRTLGDDDGYRWVDTPVPAPKRRSPFAPNSASRD